MPTELVWASITTSFRLNSYLWKTPIDWDPARRRFIFNRGGIRVFFWWYFVIFVAYLGITLGCNLYVIHGQIFHPKPHIKLFFTVQYGMVCVAGVLAADIALFVAFYGEDAIHNINGIIELYEDVMASSPGKSRVPMELWGVRIPSLLDADGRLDKVGLASVIFLTPLPCISFFLAPVGVILGNADVYRFVLEDILPLSLSANRVVNIVLVALRTGLTFVMFAENLRIFPFLVFLLGLPAQVVIRMVEKFRTSEPGTNLMQWARTLRHLTALQIVTTEVEPVLARNAFLLMGFGLALSSSLNFATIRFIDVELPPGYYLLFPFLSCAVMGVIVSLLPVAIGICESIKTTLLRWERGLQTKKDAHLRKRIKAIRPLSLYAGMNEYNLYRLDKTVMNTYMMLILDNTTNLLIFFPNVNFISKH